MSPSSDNLGSEVEDKENYRKATLATVKAINEAVSPSELTYLSNSSLEEVKSLQEEVASVIPAGNIVGLVTGSLARLRGRSLPLGQAKSDVSALMRGVEMLPRSILPKLYGTLFAGPAAILSAYQKLLAMTGNDPENAFPEGLWQFYLEFALREDSARHANETIGFQQAQENYNWSLSETDQLAAWICAVGQIYFQYDDLLYNEWNERVYLGLLEEYAKEANVSHQIHFQRLRQAWNTQRPYRRGPDSTPEEDYPLYRRHRFDNFLRSRLKHLPPEQRNKLRLTYASRLESDLSSYQEQMTILATLEPERYRENRRSIALWQARIGIIYRGNYYLLPACVTDQNGYPFLFESRQPNASFVHLQVDPQGNLCDQQGRLLQADRKGHVFEKDGNLLRGYLQPVYFQAIRRQVAAIIEHHEEQDDISELDEQFISIPRVDQEKARKSLKLKSAQQEIRDLKCAPVIINWDQQDGSLPLAYLRRGKRGIGDHALTIFRTEHSMVFDQSHIFFDGIWGMALSEILTSEAISWAAYFNSLPPATPIKQTPYKLQLRDHLDMKKFPTDIYPEVSAESKGVDVKLLYTLCKLLPKRQPDLKLTVNDILILYRCEFFHKYQPSTEFKEALSDLRSQDSLDGHAVYHLIDDALIKFQQTNPALLIPMDATATNPRERLYPTTFRNPFTNLWDCYQKAWDTLSTYQTDHTPKEWNNFTEARSLLLGQLNYFGQLLRAYKKVALEGGSTSTATLKLMGHLPDYLFALLDAIPRNFEIFNEMIKGEEVFSNVGRVARSSTLSRFLSAKDDNENKGLVWGILTDDNDTMYLTLRDFRPHVIALHKADRMDLAQMMIEDLLSAYVRGFNQFISRLFEILNVTATHASGEKSK